MGGVHPVLHDAVGSPADRLLEEDHVGALGHQVQVVVQVPEDHACRMVVGVSEGGGSPRRRPRFTVASTDIKLRWQDDVGVHTLLPSSPGHSGHMGHREAGVRGLLVQRGAKGDGPLEHQVSVDIKTECMFKLRRFHLMVDAVAVGRLALHLLQQLPQLPAWP